MILYSGYITRIADWLKSSGVRVYFKMPSNPAYSGLYRSETREIWIAPDLGAKQALLTLAHEAGHWIGYLIHERAEPTKREQQAYAYGWRVLKLFRAPISRAEWLEDCRTNETARKSRVI